MWAGTHIDNRGDFKKKKSGLNSKHECMVINKYFAVEMISPSEETSKPSSHLTVNGLIKVLQATIEAVPGAGQANIMVHEDRGEKKYLLGGIDLDLMKNHLIFHHHHRDTKVNTAKIFRDDCYKDLNPEE